MLSGPHQGKLTHVDNCQKNCQDAYFIDMSIGSGEMGRCRKGIFEQSRAEAPFGTSLSPFLKQDKKGIVPISVYTYAKSIIPAFRA
jgi:hypothetical protein